MKSGIPRHFRHMAKHIDDDPDQFMMQFHLEQRQTVAVPQTLVLATCRILLFKPLEQRLRTIDKPAVLDDDIDCETRKFVSCQLFEDGEDRPVIDLTGLKTADRRSVRHSRPAA